MNPEIVAAGLTHSLVVMSEGDVYQFGNSGDDRLSREPGIISGLPPITSVAAGSHFSLFVDHDGNAWGMGNSHYGELGFVGRCTEPQQIKFEEGVKIKMAAASRNYYSVFLDEDGSIWTCRYNGYGSLGLGHFDNTSTPSKMENIPKMSSISAGYYHTLLLDENGEVWTCGYNAYGQLGRPAEINQMSANVVKMPSPVKFKSVSAGNYHSVFLDVEGRVWGCGHNRNASLALPHTNNVDRVEMWQGNVVNHQCHTRSKLKVVRGKDLLRRANRITLLSTQEGKCGFGGKIAKGNWVWDKAVKCAKI